MWIKTERGHVVNLARCTVVSIEDGTHPDDLRVVASDGGGVEVVIADGLSKGKAIDLVENLARRQLNAAEVRDRGTLFVRK